MLKKIGKCLVKEFDNNFEHNLTPVKLTIRRTLKGIEFESKNKDSENTTYTITWKEIKQINTMKLEK